MSSSIVLRIVVEWIFMNFVIFDRAFLAYLIIFDFAFAFALQDIRRE